MERTIQPRSTMQNNTAQNKHVVINSLSKWHSFQNRKLFFYKSVGGGRGGCTLIERQFLSVGALTGDTNQCWVNRARSKD